MSSLRADFEKLKSVHVFGYAADRSVYFDDRKIQPEYSQSIRNHSPDGFSWGYFGSGCAQLALAICLELFNKDFAEREYQNFKFDFISQLPLGKDFDVTWNIYDWVNEKYK